MRSLILGLTSAFLCAIAIAQTGPAPTPVTIVTTGTTNVVAPAAIPPLPDTAPIVVQAAPAPASAWLPPGWLAKALDIVTGVPIVGPVLAIAIKWISALAALSTLLVTFLLGAIKVLSPLLNIASLTSLADKLDSFQGGTVMNWLKFFSLYNAQKTTDDPGVINGDVSKTS